MCTRARDLLLWVFLFNHIHELFNSCDERRGEWSPIRNPGSIHLLHQNYAKSVRLSTIGWTMAKLALEQNIQCSRALVCAFVHIILCDSLVFYFCVTKALISIEIHTKYPFFLCSLLYHVQKMEFYNHRRKYSYLCSTNWRPRDQVCATSEADCSRAVPHT
jgi:hypothetical protein